jgi:hypothetical protein
MRRAKECKNLSSARHYDQIRFRFHTTKTHSGHRPGRNVAVQRAGCCHASISASAGRAGEGQLGFRTIQVCPKDPPAYVWQTEMRRPQRAAVCLGGGRKVALSDLRRRDLIALLGGASAWPLAARAQSAGMLKVGMVAAGSQSRSAPNVLAFRPASSELAGITQTPRPGEVIKQELGSDVLHKQRHSKRRKRRGRR